MTIAFSRKYMWWMRRYLLIGIKIDNCFCQVRLTYIIHAKRRIKGDHSNCRSGVLVRIRATESAVL
jgi:hypothetical protein